MPPVEIKSGIYAIENKINGKVYIGSSANFAGRWWSHKDALKKGTHSNPLLQNAWRKHKPWNFIFKILISCDKAYLLVWEQIAIDGHISTIGWDNMYNLNPTAGSGRGFKWSEEAKARHSIMLRNRGKQSVETVAKRVATRRSNGSYGHSEETRIKLRQAKLGQPPRSQEYKDKMSRVLTGRKCPWLAGKKQNPDAVAKRNAANSGRKRTPEQCKNIGDGRRGKKIGPIGRVNISIAHIGIRRTPESVAKGIATKRERMNEGRYGAIGKIVRGRLK